MHAWFNARPTRLPPADFLKTFFPLFFPSLFLRAIRCVLIIRSCNRRVPILNMSLASLTVDYLMGGGDGFNYFQVSSRRNICIGIMNSSCAKLELKM